MCVLLKDITISTQPGAPLSKARPRRWPPRQWPVVRLVGWRHVPWLLVGLHLAVAFILYCRGLNFNVDPMRNSWDWYWQAISSNDLLARPWVSLWRLHAQPPGFPLWGLAWLRVAGLRHFPDAMQLGYALLGAAVAPMTYGLGRMLGLRRGWALVAGVGVALNPTLFFFEAQILYEPLVIFLVTATAWTLGRGLANWPNPRRLAATPTRPGWLTLFVVALNTLALTRSLYHWLFVLLALVFAWPLWRRLHGWRRVALLLVAILPAGCWYAKNAAQYGFFGPSSWQGLGLYKCLLKGYDYQELAALHGTGVVPDFILQHYPFQHSPKEYEALGFNRRDPLPLLARNDYHNINVPAISRAYGQAAMRLIRRDPWHYARAVFDSYIRFSKPPSRYEQIEMQRLTARLPWEPLVARILYGEWATDQLALFLGQPFGSMFFFYLPLLLAGGARWAWRRRTEGRSISATRTVTRRRARLMAYLIFVCLYVMAVGCLFENGENERFRFATEPLTLLIALTLAAAAWNRMKLTRKVASR